MVVYAFYVFDRHAECIYTKRWRDTMPGSAKSARPLSQSTIAKVASTTKAGLAADDDAKLIFGTVYSLRNMVKKLGGEDDRYSRQQRINKGYWY